MSDQAYPESRTEAALVFRWIILFPAFGVLVMLAANFTLGFFQWIVRLDGWMYWVMLVVGLLVVLSNSLASVIACMIAPRKRPAVALLGIGHLAGMLFGYVLFEWAQITAVVFVMHAAMIYLGLTVVYVLDRIHAHETADAAEPAPAPAT